MVLSKFTNDYLNCFSEKLKPAKLMGDSNEDLLKYTTDSSTAQFLDQMYSSSLLPQITSPNCISAK